MTTRSARSLSCVVMDYSNVWSAESYSREAPRRSTPTWIAIHIWSFVCLNQQKEERMSLNKEYIRDGKRRIIGSITSGFSGGTSDVARDGHNEISGRTSDLFRTTRDGRGNLVSTNTSDPGLLIGRKK